MMKTIEDKISDAFYRHHGYSNSFKKAVSAGSVEFYHPKTGKRISLSEKEHLIKADFTNRVKKILKP